MTDYTCEHGDPKPSRCALCRRREDMQLHPERYQPTQRPAQARDREHPMPVWFHEMVRAARARAKEEAQ